MKDQIGFVGFFQRRTERRYQIMRKVLYKSYGIRKDDFFAARRLQHARSGIQRSKQLIFNIYVCAVKRFNNVDFPALV